jgi:hypothetical protein
MRLMPHPSPADLLVLHAVRLKGFADAAAIADRFGLDPHQTREDLLDAQAHGRVSRTSFADLAGWSLTDTGRRRNEAQLRDEVDRTGTHATIATIHERFLPINTRASQVFTTSQLGSGRAADTFRQLADLARELHDIERSLTAHLNRFAGYHDRFTGALARAIDDPAWITGIEVDSCHRVWFELHEDLIATLGLTR